MGDGQHYIQLYFPCQLVDSFIYLFTCFGGFTARYLEYMQTDHFFWEYLCIFLNLKQGVIMRENIHTCIYLFKK